MNSQQILERMGADNGFLNITDEQRRACMDGAAGISDSVRLTGKVAALTAEMDAKLNLQWQAAKAVETERDELASRLEAMRQGMPHRNEMLQLKTGCGVGGQE